MGEGVDPEGGRGMSEEVETFREATKDSFVQFSYSMTPPPPPRVSGSAPGEVSQEAQKQCILLFVHAWCKIVPRV